MNERRPFTERSKLGRQDDTTPGYIHLPRIQQAECAPEEGAPPPIAHRRTYPTSTTAAAAKQTATAAMAPACARGAKRHCHSASAPERARNCKVSIVNEFKITSQSNFSSMFVYLLFCVVLLSSNAQSLSTRDNIDCTYSNSTCSSCADLCLTNDEFYPLFPSRCHPSYTVSTCAVATALWCPNLNVPINLQSS